MASGNGQSNTPAHTPGSTQPRNRQHGQGQGQNGQRYSKHNIRANGVSPQVMEQRIRRAWELRVINPSATLTQVAEQLVIERLGNPDGTLNIGQVKRCLDIAEQRLTERFHDNALRLKLEQSERLDHIVRESMSAWQRSQEPQVSTVTVEGRVRRNNGANASANAPNPTQQRLGPAPQPPYAEYQQIGCRATDPDPSADAYASADGEDEATTPSPNDFSNELEARGIQVMPDQVTTTVVSQVGQPVFLNTAMNAMGDQRKLWGLDAPKRTDFTSGGQPVKAYVGVDLDKV